MKRHDKYIPHRRIFLENNGGVEAIWTCSHCSNPVYYDDLAVHHIDGNHHNNELINLTAMHFGCHTSLHHTGRISTLETRVKLSKALTGKKLTPKHSASLSKAKKGTPKSEAHKAAIAEGQRRAWARRLNKSKN